MQTNDIETIRASYESIRSNMDTLKATFERMIEANELEDKQYRLKLENKYHSVGD